MVREVVRRCLLHLLWLVLRLGSRGCPPPPNGTLLVVGPHPDDIALGCSGWVLAWRRAGLPVSWICLTDGTASHPDDPEWPADHLQKAREAEERTSAAALGLDPSTLRFVGWPDGKLMDLLQQHREPSVDQLAEILRETNPAAVLVTCRDEPSSEHRAACALVLLALARAGLRSPVLEYVVWARWSPLALWWIMRQCLHWHHVAVPAADQAKLRSARSAHASQQYAPGLPRNFIRVLDRPEDVFFVYPPSG